MKFAWSDGEEMPAFEGRKKKFIVEQTEGGYWCHDADRRSAGSLPTTPLSQTLKWIVRQIVYGHYAEQTDENGDVVSLSIGQTVPYDMPNVADAAEKAAKASLGVNIAGLIAEGREKGTSQKSHDFEEFVWEKATISAHRKMELHYASVFCELLDRVAKKLEKLELLPILESAPEYTRNYLAEATRCYLLKMDRACIALCRACLEDTLNAKLTEPMKKKWIKETDCKRWSMKALIDACAWHGVLGAEQQEYAHEIRRLGNDVLHLKIEASAPAQVDVAENILKKMRTLIGFIHGSRNNPK